MHGYIYHSQYNDCETRSGSDGTLSSTVVVVHNFPNVDRLTYFGAIRTISLASVLMYVTWSLRFI